MPEPENFPDERLLTRRQTAELIGTSERTLKRWDKIGKGPTPIRFSKRMTRYSVAAVREWINAINKLAVRGEDLTWVE